MSYLNPQSLEDAPKIRLEAVSVCVNCCQYLAFTYPLNKGVLDHYVVVTSTADKETQQYCQQEGITCVVTNMMYQNSASFDKGAAINEGFKALRHREWVIHLDVDVALLASFREDLPDLTNPDLMYGAKRIILERMADYDDYRTGVKQAEDFEYPDGSGYGYFQMFHWASSIISASAHGEWYPSSRDVTESDWRFRNRWGANYPGNRCDGNLRSLDKPVLHLGAHGATQDGAGKQNTFFTLGPKIRDKSGAWL